MSLETVVAWLLTYLLHSTLLLGLAWLGCRLAGEGRLALREALWRVALVGGLVTATAQLALGVEPLGGAFRVAGAASASRSGRTEPVEVAAPSGRRWRADLDRSGRPASIRLETDELETGESGAGSPEAGPPASSSLEAAPPIWLATARILDFGAEPDLASWGATEQVAGEPLPATAVSPARWAGGRPDPAAAAPAATAGEQAPAVVPSWLAGWLLAGWLAAALLLLLRYGISHLRLLGRLRGRQAVDGPLGALFARLLALARVARPVRLSAVARLRVPLARGVARPEICVPRRMAEEMPAERQETVLAHELAHLERRDPLWLLLAALVERALCLQPLNRLARRRLQEIAELRCDDRAVELTGRPITLARCLTEVAEWGLEGGRALPVPVLAARGHGLEQRVARLLDRAYPRPGEPLPRWLRPVAAGVLALTVVAAPGITGAAAEQAGEPPVSEGASAEDASGAEPLPQLPAAPAERVGAPPAPLAPAIPAPPMAPAPRTALRPAVRPVAPAPPVRPTPVAPVLPAPVAEVAVAPQPAVAAEPPPAPRSPSAPAVAPSPPAAPAPVVAPLPVSATGGAAPASAAARPLPSETGSGPAPRPAPRAAQSPSGPDPEAGGASGGPDGRPSTERPGPDEIEAGSDAELSTPEIERDVEWAAELEAGMAELEADLGAELADLAAELATLEVEVGAELWAELEAGLGDLEVELADGLADLELELDAELISQLSELETGLGAELEAELTELREELERRLRPAFGDAEGFLAGLPAAAEAEIAEAAEIAAAWAERAADLERLTAEIAARAVPDPAEMARLEALAEQLAGLEGPDPADLERLEALAGELARLATPDPEALARLEALAAEISAAARPDAEEMARLEALANELYHQADPDPEAVARLLEEARRLAESARPDPEAMARLREESRRVREQMRLDPEREAELRAEIRELRQLAVRPRLDPEIRTRLREEAARIAREAAPQRKELERLRGELERIREEVRAAVQERRAERLKVRERDRAVAPESPPEPER